MIYILEYIKKNIQQSINVLILVLIIIVIVIIFKYRIENFEQHIKVDAESINNIKTIPTYIFTKNIATKNDKLTNKIVNFSCDINGQTYYLANMMVSDCKNKSATIPDCDIAVSVLIDETTIENGLKTYTEKLRNNEITCMKNSKIIKKSVCEQKRLYIHDFKLTNVGTTVDDIKYTIRGTSMPLLNGQQMPTLINQTIGQIHDLEIVCSGDYGYGIKKDENIYGEIYIDSKSKTDNLDDCVFKMKSYVVLKGTSGKTAVKVMENGAPKIISTYFAIDRTNKCNNYNRIKLVSDINNKDVLHFKVHIVSK
jgi:hypothetical protein